MSRPQVRQASSWTSSNTVRDWIARGEIGAYRIVKEFHIRRYHFDQAMEARRVSVQSASGGGLWDPDPRR